MAQAALDATLLTGAGLDGGLTVRWRQLAERYGPAVVALKERDPATVLSTVPPLRLARTIALVITTDNPDARLPGNQTVIYCLGEITCSTSSLTILKCQKKTPPKRGFIFGLGWATLDVSNPPEP